MPEDRHANSRSHPTALERALKTLKDLDEPPVSLWFCLPFLTNLRPVPAADFFVRGKEEHTSHTRNCAKSRWRTCCGA